MMTDSNKISNSASIGELIHDMKKHPEMYQHLKIFQRSANNNEIPVFGDEYLAVNHNGFGLYRIESVDYQNGSIIISLTDSSTNEAVVHSVDINDSQPSCLFVRWKDIKNMVFKDCMKSDRNDNDLLELIED
jgi:hypothetical protein